MHLHDDALALLALGEAPTAEEASHLEGCTRCQAEVNSYARVVRAGRSRETVDGSVPPPEVWEHIHGTLNLGAEVRRDPLADSQPEPPVSLDSKRRRRAAGWLAAAAAGALIAGAATWGIVRSQVPQPEVLASTALEPLPSYSDEGTATVDQLPDGERELIVTASSSQAEGYREVWLISPDITSMVSLGTMEGREARFRIPAGLDLSAFPIVDISDEPLDGNPEHSGKSILRGQLEL
ncbi:anti-sigma factor [Arthrobacter sp. Sa2BUA2]|uniref:Anti-sigma factor n=1 Tax=Arthrobacter pullicola TaxID=2762224 RepID=A0ABR8YMP9_9MICC|nr:anti-sigma factor [Arthrobacter pullicola]MBD8045323.1 anti-sigma factor [Arthrobacter pullicola]